MALAGNKGEWSEIYVFLYLLGKGTLDVADENLEAVPGEFYKILEILRKEINSTNNYVRADDQINIFIKNDKTGEVDSFSFPIIKFAEKAKSLLQRIKTTRDKSHPEIETFLSDIHVFSIKDVGHKRDITIKIEDFHCAMTQTLGFSIKSFLGSDSTLFNAGAGTNFIYEIKLPDETVINIDSFNQETYVKTPRIPVRLQTLIDEYKAEIAFSSIQSRCFSQNLRTIDGDLPLLISHLLLIRYLKGESTIKRCTEILTEQNPLDFDIENHGSVYEYKVKRFLHDCALGMVPEKPWQGIYDATGGQIIVKEDGQVVCYHIYEQNRFLNYLYNSTKFEGASTSEDENSPGHPRQKVAGKTLKPFFYGWLYEENGKLYFKLNLQVRFK